MTFSAHLALSTGLELCKPGKRTEKRKRDFGYGVGYRICTDMGATPALITAIDPSFYWALPLFPEGSWLVLHDPTELKAELHPLFPRFEIVVIRKSMQDLLAAKGIASRFLPHPFHPYPRPEAGPRVRAVGISRIDFDKNVDLVLGANGSLGERKILLYGALNRLCAYHKLDREKLQEVYQGAFGKSWEELGSILKDAAWVVDLSTIQRDGGGTQYTFLEAIYNGSALILHRKWLEGGAGPFKDGVNCAAVSTSAELVQTLEEVSPVALAEEAKKILEPHLAVRWRDELDL